MYLCLKITFFNSFALSSVELDLFDNFSQLLDLQMERKKENMEAWLRRS